MKNILTTILLLLSITIFAQNNNEVLSITKEYVTHQDSFLITKITTIQSTNITGINDTLITYIEPLDTNTIITQLTSVYLNKVNTNASRFRLAQEMRFFLQDYLAFKSDMTNLGLNADSILVQTYKRKYLGNWRITLNDGTTFNATLAEHPTRNDILRLTGNNSEGVFNFIIYGENHFRISNANTNEFLNLDNKINNLYRSMTFNLPIIIVPANNFRMLKLK